MPQSRNFALLTRDEIAIELALIALAGAAPIMQVYAEGCAHREKTDGSPVTEADERAEALIDTRLNALAPGVRIVAEEAVAGGAAIVEASEFFLVDPLDGTREFLARNGEFTVNAALIRQRQPVAGAVYAPALGRLWFAGEAAYCVEAPVGAALPDPSSWRRLKTRSAPEKLIALASRSHADAETKAFLATIPLASLKSAGSSLKFCVVAEGEADVYPRFGPTMEWDTAAGDAVLRAAGGVALTREGAPFLYGKFAAGLRNGAFIAWGDAEAAARQR